MTIIKYLPRSRAKAALLGILIAGKITGSYATVIVPSNMPLENIDRALSNVVLALSVEFPTGDTASYANGNGGGSASATYSSATTFYGYFDPVKCYSYSASSLYFSPVACAAGTFKGNLLNWAAMANIDQFRQILTGGNRIIDTATNTVLQRAYNDTQSNTSSYFPNRSATTSDANVSTQLTYRSANLGDKMLVQSGASINTTGLSVAQMATQDCATLATTWGNANKINNVAQPAPWTCYHVRVKVCDKTAGLEGNCIDYSTTGGSAKPEGLMQQYNQNMRFSAFGYLNDGTRARQGGVLRARMKSVGPTIADPIAISTANPKLEWSSTTGVFAANPDSSDQAATTGATGSGVVNYLNQFGYASGYKGYDPMAELYYEALRYLRKMSPTPQAISSYTTAMVDGFPVINFDSSVPANDPVVSACQQNFILTIGDVNNHCDTRVPGGSVNSNCTGTLPVGDTVNFANWTNTVATMDSYATAAANQSPGRYAGWYLGGLAYWAHVNDIRPDYATKRVAGTVQNVTSFFVDVMEPYNGQNPVQTGSTKTPMYLAAKYGGFNRSLAVNDNPTQTISGSAINPWDKNNNGTPDNWYAGNDPVTMRAGLNDVFQQIVAAGSLGSGAAPATSGVSIATAKNVYYASYSLVNGGLGSVKACSFSATSTQCLNNPDWDAAAWLDPTVVNTYSTYQDNTTRQIITRSGGSGVPFKYTSLSIADKATMDINPSTKLTDTPTLLGAKRVDYIRGDSSMETSKSGGIFRTRTSTKLGDIVGSGTVYVGAPSSLYSGTLFTGYSSFLANKKNRSPVLYVGANDGMLHAFDASASGKGKELFAYVPGYFLKADPATAAARVSALTTLTYTHQFYVDSTPMVGDVKLSNTNWATLLVGSYGAGGKGLFALDITDPSSFSEANASSISKWEFSDSDDVDMGYSFNQPTQSPISGQALQFAKINDGTASGKWAIIVGNGFGSTNGKAVLYFLSPDDGSIIKKIEVESSAGSNGLATPFPVSTKTNGLIDTVWAGDLQGNMWRISYNTTTKDWDVVKSFKGDPTKPITAAPVATPHATLAGAWAVVFATGKYIERPDFKTTTQQTIYGIADTFANTSIQQSDLVAQTVLSTSTPDTNGDFIRTTSSNTVDFASKKGWYFDLPTTNGERSSVNPVIPADTGIVLVSSFTPATACLPGTGYVNVLNASNGAAVVNASGTVIPSTGAQGMGISYLGTVVSSGTKAIVKVGGLGPWKTQLELIKPAVSSVRFSWRQIR
ncbi:MAG: PilC/PilY family type IV pilus protein [Pseudomonadota bacterium]